MFPEEFLQKLKEHGIAVLDRELDDKGEVLRLSLFIRRYGAMSVPRWVILDNNWNYFAEKFGLPKEKA